MVKQNDNEKIITTAALLFSSLNHASAFHTPETVPKNLHIYSMEGSTYVDLVAAGCSGSRNYLNQNHIKYDAIFAVLLAAQTAGKKCKYE